MSVPSFEGDLRRARVQILDVLRSARTWADVMQAVDALFHVKLLAGPLIEESKIHNQAGVVEMAISRLEAEEAKARDAHGDVHGGFTLADPPVRGGS